VVSIRLASAEDTAGIARVSAAVGQAGAGSAADAAYLNLLRVTGTVLVAVDGPTLLGWGATRPTHHGAVLTDLFVDPTWHGQGVGASILRGLWPDPATPGRYTFSSQHVNAVPLYLRAGLRPIWPLLYLGGSRARLPDTSYRVEPVGPDVAAAAESRLGGGDRSADYRYWAQLPGHQPITVASAARVVAVGVLGIGDVAHLACPAANDAGDALVAALRALPTDTVTCCIPGPHPGTTTLVDAGFRPRDYDLTMTTPDCALPTSWVYSPGLA
jgi:GNAT superfamily N-acetyltransferase